MRVPVAAGLVLLLSTSGLSSRSLHADPQEAPGLTTPFVNGRGEVSTLFRPEFRDAPGLVEDLQTFGIEGLGLDLVGPQVIGPDGKTRIPSRLVLKGPPDLVSRGRQVLRYLDVPEPAVIVSLLAAEVQCNDTGETGGTLAFLRAGVQDAPNTIFRGAYSEFEPGAYLRSSLAATRPFQGSSVRFANLGQDILDDGAFEYVLRFYAEQNRAEFLAWPTIVCTEGRPGVVASTEASEERVVTAASANAGDTQIQNRTVESGVAFSVVPVRIGSDAALLDLQADIRFLVPQEAEGTAAGEVVKNHHIVATQFTIRDQESLLIGGLKFRRRVGETTGLPLLSGMPGLTARARTYVTSELILLVRIRILVGGRSAGLVAPPGEARRLEVVRRLEADAGARPCQGAPGAR